MQATVNARLLETLIFRHYSSMRGRISTKLRTWPLQDLPKLLQFRYFVAISIFQALLIDS